ncbi:MAG: PhoU domain-containing protein [Collinsella sp.]|nr:PhoU domain-containing protein [Collinsella sp.]
MRKLFSRQLIEARHEMLSIFEAIDLALHDAVRAYVTDDKKLATRTQEAAFRIDARCANLEAVCYNLIATQSPVASDFRLLQTIIYIDFNLQRMCDKVRRIARAAKRKVNNDIELPTEMVRLIEDEAQSVYRVLGATATALVNNDLSCVLGLSEEDEAVHGAYQEFFRCFNRGANVELEDDSAMDDFRRTIMVSRYLDRIASISMECAYRLVFLLTGQRWTAADLADTDEDELESMRIPSGEGVILKPSVDARFVADLPLDEVGDELAELIRKATEDDRD